MSAGPVVAPVLLRVRGVERRFASAAGSTLALQATDLDVAENDFVTILGPSGCGKSTLLRIVAGLDHGNGGRSATGWPPHHQSRCRPRHGLPELHAVPVADGAATTSASACANAGCHGSSSWNWRRATSSRWA
jgi:energy-coupling factor transporter ATP-binding protein EcfA2